MNYICIVCDGKEIVFGAEETAEEIQDFMLNSRYTDRVFTIDKSDKRNRRIILDPNKVSVVMDVTEQINRFTKACKPINIKKDTNITEEAIVKMGEILEKSLKRSIRRN